MFHGEDMVKSKGVRILVLIIREERSRDCGIHCIGFRGQPRKEVGGNKYTVSNQGNGKRTVAPL